MLGRPGAMPEGAVWDKPEGARAHGGAMPAPPAPADPGKNMDAFHFKADKAEKLADKELKDNLHKAGEDRDGKDKGALRPMAPQVGGGGGRGLGGMNGPVPGGGLQGGFGGQPPGMAGMGL